MLISVIMIDGNQDLLEDYFLKKVLSWSSNESNHMRAQYHLHEHLKELWLFVFLIKWSRD